MTKMNRKRCIVKCKFAASGNCSKCCYETEMPLTQDDVARIVSLGYDIKDFARKLNGLFVLKNINGHCFFLKNNKCSIYNFRPLGCKLYPLVYDVNNNTVKIDPDCPHNEEFNLYELEYAFDCLITLAKEIIEEEKWF
ncbi:MAG: YkgJ family cysteine cluster protein [Candidatus Heimdallarchaeaceae archaeon]